MSISTRIEAIEQHLTDDYNVLTLAGADLTNVDKNILNLKPTWKERLLYFINNGTDEVWDNWDKVNGTGETLSLNNTEEAPMSLVYKGNTIQSGTPTPDSPVPIQVVSGDNSIEVCGKNLFDDSVERKNAFPSTTVGSTITYTNSGATYSYVNGAYLKAGETYTISWTQTTTPASTNSRAGAIVDKNNIVLQGVGTWTNSANYITFTPTTTGYLVVSTDINATNIQIELGNQATTYEAYTGESYPISLTSKNLAPTNWVSDFITRINDNSRAHLEMIDNRICLFYTASAGSGEYDTKYMFKTNWKANTQYTVSYYGKSSNGYLNLVIEHTDGTTVGIAGAPILDWTKVSLTSTANKTIKYVRVVWSGGNTYIDINTFMVNEGTSALPYEEYTTPIELNKIGTYQDKIDKSTGSNILDIQNGTAEANSVKVVVDTGNIAISGNGTTENTFSFLGSPIQRISRYFQAVTLSETNSVKLKAGTYILNYEVPSGISFLRYYGNLGDRLDACTVIPQNTSFTITEDKYIFLGLYTSTGNISANIKEIRLNKGTTSLPYEPYGTSWYVKKEIGKVVLNGSESFVRYSALDTTNYNCFYITSSLAKMDSAGNNYWILSNYFKGDKFDNRSVDIANAWLGKFANQIAFKVPNTITTTGELQTWLGTHNTTMYYVLATPTYTLIEDSTLISQLEALKSKTGQTNISQTNNDLPFELSVIALSQE